MNEERGSSLNDAINEADIENLEDLSALLKDYEKLTDNQEEERLKLLSRIDQITQHTRKLDNIDAKLDKFSALLLDIRSQIASNPDAPETPSNEIENSDKPQILASDADIKTLSLKVQQKSDTLDEEIASLTHLLGKKQNTVDDKDLEIEELNDRLALLNEEKSRLAQELERLNSDIDSWDNQLELLHQLASSDPRYRVIESLKKHESLSDIQLAFTMGTSINQLRKYLEDLMRLDLVEKSPEGRYSLTGKDTEEYF